MTYSLVQKSAAAATLAVPGPTNATLPAGSTAGNLLICKISYANSTSAAPTFTLPGGWVQAVSLVNSGGPGQPVAQVWYLPNCSAGISAVAITQGGTGSTSATGGGYLEEFHDSAGTNTTPLDVTGTGTTVTTPSAISASTVTTAAHELAVAVSAALYSSATKDTLNAGTGFTQAGSVNNATKTVNHYSYDYELDTGASAGITITDSVTFTGPFLLFSGVIATFAPFTAPPPGLLPQQLCHHAPKQALARPHHTAGYRS